MIPARHAFACADSFAATHRLETAITAAIAVTVFVAALTLAVWLVRWLLALKFSLPGVVSVLLGIALGLIGTFVLSAFQEVFEAFGADLPTLTAWAFDFRYFLWTPLLLTAIWQRLSRPGASRHRGHLIGLAAQTMLLSLVHYAMYSPIFRIGCVIE
jgi:hypothetical protein